MVGWTLWTGRGLFGGVGAQCLYTSHSAGTILASPQYILANTNKINREANFEAIG